MALHLQHGATLKIQLTRTNASIFSSSATVLFLSACVAPFMRHTYLCIICKYVWTGSYFSCREPIVNTFCRVNEFLKTNLCILGGQFGVIHSIFVFLRVEHHSHVSKALIFMPWVFLPTPIRGKKDLVLRGDMGK